MIKKTGHIISNEHSEKGLSSLSSSLAPLIKKLLGKNGLAEAEILSSWKDIAGETLAQYTLPQRIDFKKNSRTGGILYLMTAGGAFALELQHKTPAILEKINTFFGYEAVTQIKFIQNEALPAKPVMPIDDDKSEKKLVTPEEQNYISKVTEEIQNPALRLRLAKLGESIFKQSK